MRVEKKSLKWGILTSRYIGNPHTNECRIFNCLLTNFSDCQLRTRCGDNEVAKPDFNNRYK